MSLTEEEPIGYACFDCNKTFKNFPKNHWYHFVEAIYPSDLERDEAERKRIKLSLGRAEA